MNCQQARPRRSILPTTHKMRNLAIIVFTVLSMIVLASSVSADSDGKLNNFSQRLKAARAFLLKNLQSEASDDAEKRGVKDDFYGFPLSFGKRGKQDNIYGWTMFKRDQEKE
ncbi:uncharacterized protein [Ptychodera flava]|uniref:uncharacterized protein n=1 Tax=Ptychodera flava TaxID=63121 RepID=UPI00396A15CD